MRILICEQHTLFREGIKAVLLTHPSIEVVGTAGDGRQVFERVLSTRPDVVLLDVSMCHLGGFDGVDFITQADSSIRILIFTDYQEEELLAECLNSGASGFVRKDATSDQLIEALQTVYDGGTYSMPHPTDCIGDCTPEYSLNRAVGSTSGDCYALAAKRAEFIPHKNLIVFPSSN